jgi:NAD(P)-dependent dehydrogenase (short-subunit alcohol dehydrogenase family)
MFKSPKKCRWPLVWITGASSGIGLAVAERLARTGSRVILSARSAERLEDLSREEARFVGLPLDVTDERAVRDTVARIVAEHGVPDLVILNAGLWTPYDMAKDGIAPDDHIASMRVNYYGQVFPIAALLPHFKERTRGHFALMASVAGYRGLPRAGAYGPSKAAAIALAETMRAELTPLGIDVSVINPGFVETPMTAANDFPMPFLMTTEKAADAIVRGLAKRKFEVAFPWQMVAILKIARVLPYRLYFGLIRRFGGG